MSSDSRTILKNRADFPICGLSGNRRAAHHRSRCPILQANRIPDHRDGPTESDKSANPWHCPTLSCTTREYPSNANPIVAVTQKLFTDPQSMAQPSGIAWHHTISWVHWPYRKNAPPGAVDARIGSGIRFAPTTAVLSLLGVRCKSLWDRLSSRSIRRGTHWKTDRKVGPT